ncbi:metallo-beta-lactamase family protein [Duganella sp. CF402]|uniref:MBL fold metallo-hydrolase RNA specificity domain-containing protein n=1 Tax=unclassified Duganella TaxID=2636909 RepID=UPI0008C2AC9C|nr:MULTISPECIES: MBL fold metallo-hydrolase [unclassified Duganella]RZT11046.1 metallo-beta-lactamase family protein [Duganella sp. BK701]SEK84088.1 metallo-beta-lactamase family protein [Duganella sp. CF402]
MHIRFLGATGTVTGSKYLLTSGGATMLLDCGLFQGYKQLRLRNWDALPVAPAEIDAVVLTHAHLDHSGYLPLLVKNGFRGKVLCSEATYDLCKILLPDSGRLLEEEAIHANRQGSSRHAPAQPLYTEADAVRALGHFSPVPFGKPFEIADKLSGTLALGGHILGAAIVTISDGQRSVVFSGDLGRLHDAIMVEPSAIAHCDYLVLESTYGDRRHDPADPLILLGQTIRKTAARGGVTVIPAFAVGRAQSLLYAIHQLKQQGMLPAALPVYLNSPMATDATALYQKHRKLHRLDHQQCEAMCRTAHIVNSVEESIALNQRQVPMVIIAASGMATGGRVLHHLKAFGGDARNTILFAGFQAGGTRGAAMLGGATEIKIYGEYVPLRASVYQIDNLSAHADADEILQWLGHFKQPPRRTFITHGEPAAADALRHRIEETLHWHCRVPDYLEQLELR